MFLENKEYSMKQWQIVEEKNKARQLRRESALEFVKKLEKDKVRKLTLN